MKTCTQCGENTKRLNGLIDYIESHKLLRTSDGEM